MRFLQTRRPHSQAAQSAALHRLHERCEVEFRWFRTVVWCYLAQRTQTLPSHPAPQILLWAPPWNEANISCISCARPTKKPSQSLLYYCCCLGFIVFHILLCRSTNVSGDEVIACTIRVPFYVWRSLGIEWLLVLPFKRCSPIHIRCGRTRTSGLNVCRQHYNSARYCNYII